MSYNRRDLIGHWVTKEQRTQRPCTHACCRGYRVHPKNMPVILPNRTLRRATDDDLAQHYMAVSAQDTPAARRAEAQIMHEMERRDRAEEERARRREAIAARRATDRMAREAESQRIRLAAEGRARGITDEEILTGREAVFIRYASPEAKEHFAEHPRPTAAYLRYGRDTRVLYSDRPSRPRRPARPRRIAA